VQGGEAPADAPVGDLVARLGELATALATEREATERVRADLEVRVAALEAREHGVDRVALDAAIAGVRDELAKSISDERERAAGSEAAARNFLVRAEEAHAAHLRELQRVFLARLLDAAKPGFAARIAEDARRALAEFERDERSEAEAGSP
jgi:hypothetical protein